MGNGCYERMTSIQVCATVLFPRDHYNVHITVGVNLSQCKVNISPVILKKKHYSQLKIEYRSGRIFFQNIAKISKTSLLNEARRQRRFRTTCAFPQSPQNLNWAHL